MINLGCHTCSNRSKCRLAKTPEKTNSLQHIDALTANMLEQAGIYSVAGVFQCREYIAGESTLLELAKEVSKCRGQSDIPQSVYISEECSELNKEMMKFIRGKGDIIHAKEEFADVVAAALIFFTENDIRLDYVQEAVEKKYRRAIERYKNGEF